MHIEKNYNEIMLVARQIVTNLMENKKDELISGIIRSNMEVDISYIKQVLGF